MPIFQSAINIENVISNYYVKKSYCDWLEKEIEKRRLRNSNTNQVGCLPETITIINYRCINKIHVINTGYKYNIIYNIIYKYSDILIHNIIIC